MATCIHCGVPFRDGNFVGAHAPSCPLAGPSPTYPTTTTEPRRNKFGAQQMEVDGIKFASRLEARRYQVLVLRQQAGEITDLETQPKYELQPAFTDRDGKKWRAIHYLGDFRYREGDKLVVEDTKGKETEVFRIKRKLLLRKYPDLYFRTIKNDD